MQNTRIKKCDHESDTLVFKSDYMMHNSTYIYNYLKKIKIIIILDSELDMVKRSNFNCPT